MPAASTPPARHLRAVPCLDPSVSDGALLLAAELRRELSDVAAVRDVHVRDLAGSLPPAPTGLRVLERLVESHDERFWIRVLHADRPLVAELVRAKVSIVEARLREERLMSEREVLRDRFEAVQDRMVERSRLAALGTLAASVAHDIRSPLTVLSANHDYLMQVLGQVDPSERDEVASILDDNLLALEVVEGVLDSLRSFASDGETCRTLRLEPVLRSAIRLTRLHFRRRTIELALRIDPGMIAVGTPGEICQILMNLLMNAADAAPESSVVQVWAHGNDDRALVWIADDGPGVAPGDREAIFEPFHTSKPTGMGLGLAIAREMARRQGGDLRLLDGAPPGFALPPAGACFELRLPTDLIAIR